MAGYRANGIFAAMFFLLQSGLWQKLVEFDQWLFIKINSQWTNPVFDSLMPFMRNGLHWIPLYLFFGVFAILNFKKDGAWWCLLLLVTVAMTDLAGTYIFKHNIARVRPCNSMTFQTYVRLLLDHCSYGNSFISNHSANHVGMGVFFFFTMKHVIGKWAFIGVLWGLLIAYSQVYVGVHYPFDVLAGALVGLIFGIFTSTVFNKRFGFATFENQPTKSS